MPSKKKIVFFHIPKTAGRVIHSSLVNRFQAKEVFPYRDLDERSSKNVRESEFERYQIYSGHLSFCFLEKIKGPKFVFTFLREPFECFNSGWKHARSTKEDFWHPAVSVMSERRAIELIPQVYANRQTRFIHSFLYEDARSFESLNGFVSLKILDRVMRRIDAFDFVGIHESIAESCEVLSQELMIPFDHLVTGHTNESGNRDQVWRKHVTHLLGLDAALYGHFKSQLDAKVLSQREARWESSLCQSLIAFENGVTYSFATGWLPDEATGPQQVLRWSAPGRQSVILVRSPSTKLQVVIRVLHCFFEAEGDLVISLNDQQVIFGLQSVDSALEISFRIDVQPNRTERLAFISLRPHSFYELNQTADHTLRNFQLQSISMTPV